MTHTATGESALTRPLFFCTATGESVLILLFSTEPLVNRVLIHPLFSAQPLVNQHLFVVTYLTFFQTTYVTDFILVLLYATSSFFFEY